MIRVARLCLVVQGPGFPCSCPGAYPGALFSVVVRSPNRSDTNRSDTNRSASRSGNNSSRSASRAANNSSRSTSRAADNSYRPARGRKLNLILSFLSRIHLPRWGTGLPTERVRRVTKRACASICQVWLVIGWIQTKRRSSLMFVGLRRSEVMAKTGFFYCHMAPSAKLQQWEKDVTLPCLGFPLHDLLWSYKSTFFLPNCTKSALPSRCIYQHLRSVI